MSDGDWSRKSSNYYLIPLLVAVVLSLFVWLFYRNSHETERTEAGKPNVEKAVAACEGGGDVIVDMSCVVEAARAEAEKQRDEADLRAQQDIAEWSLLMLFATCIAVLYVALTLQATRATLQEAKAATKAAQDAVTVTREIGEAQVRAYLNVTEAYFLEGFGQRFIIPTSPFIRLRIRNSGQSPATRVRFDGEIAFFDRDILDQRSTPSFLSEIAVSELEDMGAESELDCVLEIGPFNPRVHGLYTTEKGIGMQIMGTLGWTDVFGSSHTKDVTFSQQLGESRYLAPNGIKLDPGHYNKDYCP